MPKDFDDLPGSRAGSLTHKPYDLSLLEELEDEEQLRGIVDLFLTNTPLQLQELLTDAGKQDWEKIAWHTHKLKSSAGVLQANGLLDLLRKIEEQAKLRKDPGLINGLLQDLMTAFSEVEILLKKE